MNTTQTDVMALFVQNFLFRQNMMQIQIDQLTYQNINCLRCFNGGRLGLIRDRESSESTMSDLLDN